ncbi:unnamed protein product [Rotaria socialis]|uniref:NAD(P)(+)--arginine ADP-ribosyltransferase n=1 Tax=Rotaria socialis TaxID=392032 RepID=A0A820GH52_9BILA|nr:unnamed protein product [Rotaria socialis]CAF4277072.1 unnamed protein product [Rotaria socialis]
MASTDSIDNNIIERLEARSYDIFQEPLIYLLPICIVDQNPSITLEKALEPLISTLPNLQKHISTTKQRCKNPADGLTQDESASIMLYSMNSQPMEQCLYYVLNSALRSGDRRKLKPWLLYLSLLAKALSRLPSIAAVVHRQVQIGLTEKYPIEKTFVWWAFSLCILSLDIYQSNEHLTKTQTCTIFTIECRFGKDIRKHSYFPNEDQILLMAGSEFKVISSMKNETNQNIIYLKEIQSNNPLLQFSNISNQEEILSASSLLNISDMNVQSRSETQLIPKYIDHQLKLQKKIQKYSKNSPIDLVNENLNDQDIPLVIQHAIFNKQCTVLRLDENCITSEGATTLAESLHNNRTLVGLNLCANRLFDNGIRPFVQLLSDNYPVLQKLHLGSNEISNEGVLLLSEMLKTNTKLTVLWLDSNRISDEGIYFLANTLIHCNRTLQELSLSNNKLITSLSVPCFIEICQKNQSLTWLDISDCSLTKQDNQRLKFISNGNQHSVLQLDTEESDCFVS